jgi:hypothetical protein
MANGTAALALLPPAPEPTHASPSANDQEGIKVELGRLMADAVEALGRSLADYDAGGLTNASRELGGITIAAVVELQLAALGTMPEFADVALVEGKRILHARHGAVLAQHLGSDAGIDDVFGELLSHILAVATKVAAVEAVYRSN